MQIYLNKEVQLADTIEIIKEKLNSGGTVTFTPNGTSMLPLLRDGEDVVVLSKPKGRLHLFDVALYRRKNGDYVLHRVVDFDADGGYVMCGDNQFHYEHGIMSEDIIGVMTAFYRKGKSYVRTSFKYKIYINWLYHTRFARHTYSFGKRKISNLFNKGNKKVDENNIE